MAEIQLTESNFEKEILSSELPALVDFWAPWCGPCRMLGPVISEIADEYDDRIVVGKVNVDEEPELAEKYGVEAIPLVLLFDKGEVVERSVGFKPKDEFVDMLENVL